MPNESLVYYGVKNEHVLVCPKCGSTRVRRRVTKYITVKSGLQGHHPKRVRREYQCVCRHCNGEFNNPVSLQEWLTERFNEAREMERRGVVKSCQ